MLIEIGTDIKEYVLPQSNTNFLKINCYQILYMLNNIFTITPKLGFIV